MLREKKLAASRGKTSPRDGWRSPAGSQFSRPAAEPEAGHNFAAQQPSGEDRVETWLKEFDHAAARTAPGLDANSAVAGDRRLSRESAATGRNPLESGGVSGVAFSFLCQLLEKYGTLIERNTALIEKVSHPAGLLSTSSVPVRVLREWTSPISPTGQSGWRARLRWAARWSSFPRPCVGICCGCGSPGLAVRIPGSDPGSGCHGAGPGPGAAGQWCGDVRGGERRRTRSCCR
eukprot:SAG31_NODE_1785_length_7278_cov_4.205321_6_plen_233_part_00